MHLRPDMEATHDSESWMGPLEYPNDRTHIILTFILLPIAAAAFAFLVAKTAIWM